MYQLYLEDGYTDAPVLYEALDKQLSKAYLVADNETARKAQTDTNQLDGLLQDISKIPAFDIEATGFDLEELDQLLELPNIYFNEYSSPQLQPNNNISAVTSTNPSYIDKKYSEIPEDSPEYDESIADEVKACVCPKCGFKFPDKV